MKTKKATRQSAPSRKGIEQEILYGIGARILAVFALIAIVTIAMVWVVMTSAKQKELTLASESAANKLTDFFDQYIKMSQQMAVNPEIIDLLDNTKEGDSILEQPGFPTVYQDMVNIAGIDTENIMAAWVSDIDANVLTQSDDFTSGEGWEFMSRVWSVCTQTGETVVTEPYIDASTGNMILSAVSPVYAADGEVLGAAGLDISLAHIGDVMADYTIGRGGYLILTSAEGMILYDKDASLIQKTVSEAGFSDHIVNALNNSEQIFTKYRSPAGTRYGYIASIGETGYHIISSLSALEYHENLFWIILALIVVFVIGIVLLTVSIRKISHSLSEPILKLNETAQKLAQGELDVDIDIHSKNEIGELGDSIQATVTRLKEYIRYIDELSEVLSRFADGKLAVELKNDYTGEFQKLKEALLLISRSMVDVMKNVTNSSQQVSGGADELAGAAQMLAESSGTQAAAVEELLATSTTVVEQVNRSREGFEASAEETQKVTLMMERSQSQMNQMMEAMSKIQETSRQVVGIIQTIEEIAEQTNLLSLNASIEAARAGESGRGFAVVAGEIGKLAEESSKAANTTRVLIGVSMEEISRGNERAQEVVSSLHDTVEAVERVSRLITEAAQIASAQTESMEQIRLGVEDISQSIQDNSATAQESSATSQELAAQASILNQMLQKFQLPE